MIHMKKSSPTNKSQTKPEQVRMSIILSEKKESCGGICVKELWEKVKFNRIQDGVGWASHTNKIVLSKHMSTRGVKLLLSECTIIESK